MTLLPAVKKLRLFLKGNKISQRKAATALNVSQPTIIDWLRGWKTPTSAHQEAIELWTGGIVQVSDWELRKPKQTPAKAKAWKRGVSPRTRVDA